MIVQNLILILTLIHPASNANTYDKIPRISGPSANVPSRLHARTVHAMLESLDVVYSERHLDGDASGSSGRLLS